ncbi:MAG: DUF3276 family protein [Flavobacteriales bacterium]
MSEGYQGGDLFSTSVRAGKRTYFFDVKATRGNDLFLTITESKKVGHQEDGPVHFEKHKIFLYKEDFDGFMDALNEAMGEIRNKQGKDGFRTAESPRRSTNKGEDSQQFSDVSFEDLDSSAESL